VTAKPINPRHIALRDIDEAIRYYMGEAGADVALRFVEAVEDAFRVISARPATGSARYADLLELPGLRCRKLGRFPYLLFYLERVDHIDVWRLLHAQRDIASWMA